MIEHNGRDDAHDRGHHVCGIKPPTEANLYDLEVSAYLGEVQECHCGDELEEGDVAMVAILRDPLGIGPHALHKRGEVVPADRL